MTDAKLYSRISILPDSLKSEVSDFVDFISQKQKKSKLVKARKFGCASGLIEMSDDFDEPLDEFKDYM